MTNDGGNETPLSLGPQEWQWYLQEKDLIPSDVTLEVGTAIKRIDFLSPTATVVCRNSIDESDMDTSITVAQGLLWLHRACFQDISVLGKALLEAQSHESLLHQRNELYQANLTHAIQDWNRLCCGYGLSDVLNEDTENISQVIQEWQETQQRRKHQEELQHILSRHSEFLASAVSKYQQLCKQTRQSPVDMAQVSSLTMQENNVEYSAETITLLRMELEELFSFYQARQHECTKQSIPTFMTLVTMDNVDTLEEYIVGLKQVLKEIKSVQSGIVDSNQVKVLETSQARVQISRQRVEENSRQVENVESKIKRLEGDLQWCQERIQSIKTTIEKEITTLLGDNSDVAIKLSPQN